MRGEDVEPTRRGGALQRLEGVPDGLHPHALSEVSRGTKLWWGSCLCAYAQLVLPSLPVRRLGRALLQLRAARRIVQHEHVGCAVGAGRRRSEHPCILHHARWLAASPLPPRGAAAAPPWVTGLCRPDGAESTPHRPHHKLTSVAKTAVWARSEGRRQHSESTARGAGALDYLEAMERDPSEPVRGRGAGGGRTKPRCTSSVRRSSSRSKESRSWRRRLAKASRAQPFGSNFVSKSSVGLRPFDSARLRGHPWQRSYARAGIPLFRSQF